MAQKKVLGYISMGVGIILVLGSLLADVIGIGPQSGFGKLQGIVMLLGGVIGIAGFVLKR
jgi:hypothetical protein